MIDLRPFAPDDLGELALVANGDVASILENDAYRAAMSVPELSYTLANGKALACGGVIPWKAGVGYAWLFAAPKVPRFAWKLALRQCRDGIRRAHAKGLRRIEAYVALSWAEAHRLVMSAGFEFEGLGRSVHGTAEDYACYVHLWPRAPLPPLVRHQLRELHRAVLATYAPRALSALRERPGR